MTSFKNSCLIGQWMRGIEYGPTPNGLIRHTHTHTDKLFSSPPLRLCWTLSVNDDSTFQLNILTSPWACFIRRNCELMVCHHNRLPPYLSRHLSSSLVCDSQRRPFIQDVQAQEEYPRGISPVWAVETCRGYVGKWKPAHGSHVAWGWRLKRVGRSQ